MLVIMNFKRSKHGRAIMAIRDNRIAAEATGVNVVYYKLMVFMLAAFFAGAAGVLYGYSLPVVQADTFGYNMSIEILVIVVLGGMGNIGGSIPAAIVLRALPEALRDFSDYRMLAYSVLLIAIMLLNENKRFKAWKSRFSLSVGSADCGAGKPAERRRTHHESFSEARRTATAPTAPGWFRTPPVRSSRSAISARRRCWRHCTSASTSAVRLPWMIFSLVVGKTEIAGLIGYNGAGKTTVFNLLTNIYQPTRGNIMLDGYSTAGKTTAQLSEMGVARTFQNIRLFGNMSVEDNIKVGLHNATRESLLAAVTHTFGYAKREREAHEKALELLDFFGMADLADAPAGNLPLRRTASAGDRAGAGNRT